MSNLCKWTGVNGEALQVHTVYEKPYFKTEFVCIRYYKLRAMSQCVKVSMMKPLSQYQAILVSCPDPTLSQRKGSGDHWVISWLCRVSSLDTKQPNEITLCHATMYSTDRPICSLVPGPHPCLCCTIQVTGLMAFCWLSTTKKSLNGHQTPFLMRSGPGTRLSYAGKNVMHSFVCWLACLLHTCNDIQTATNLWYFRYSLLIEEEMLL